MAGPPHGARLRGLRASSRSLAARAGAGAAREPRSRSRCGGDRRHLAASCRAMCCRSRCCRPRCCSPASPPSRSWSGVGTAWVVTDLRISRPRRVLIWLLPLPLAIPTYIVAYVYVDMLDALGPVQTALRARLRLAIGRRLLVPERALARRRDLRHRLRALSLRLSRRARDVSDPERARSIEVARTLGAGRWRLARDITLPLARPAIAVGLALALLETLNDIGASEYLGVQTLTLSIFTTWLNRGSLPGAAQIACVMLLVVAALIALERYGRRRQRLRRASTAGRRHRRAHRARAAARAGSRRSPASCRSVLGFLLPAGYLVHEVIARGLLVGFDPSLVAPCRSPPSRSRGRATALVLVLGFRGGRGARCLRRPAIAACVNVAGLGYAVPGTVLALGLLSPLVAVDEAINALARVLGGGGVGLRARGLGGGAGHRLCDPLSGHRDRLRAGRASPASRPNSTTSRASLGAGPAAACARDPSAAAAAGALGRGAAGLRRLPEGTAGDAAAAAAQCRDAVDLHLPVRHPRQFRGGRARGAAASSRSASCR